MGVADLRRRHPQRVPLDPRQDVAQEGGVVLHVGLLELGVLEVQRVGGGRGLAGFDGAGEEVGGEDLHGGGGWGGGVGEVMEVSCYEVVRGL